MVPDAIASHVQNTRGIFEFHGAGDTLESLFRNDLYLTLPYERCRQISFSLEARDGNRAGTDVVRPVINGTPLTDLVAGFEREHNFEPAGGYGVLDLGYFNYGPLDRYFMGEYEPDSYWSELGVVGTLSSRRHLLGVVCGCSAHYPNRP